MEITIGNKIKQLRKACNRTQENMAQALGVTSQAVSKWENGIGYPDIEYIPSIANYFGVTIDALFGYDGDRTEKIRSILEHAAEMESAGTEPSECLDYMRLAAAEFPASDAVTLRLANTLMRCGWQYHGAASLSGTEKTDDGMLEEWSHPDYEHNCANKYWQEALALYEGLLDTTDEADVREEATDNVLMIYWEFGNHSALAKLAAKAPHLRHSRELILARDESFNYRAGALMTVLRTMKDLMFSTVKAWRAKTEDNIRECEQIIAMYEHIFEDGRCGRYHEDLYDLYARLTYYYWKIDEKDKAMDALARSKEHCDKFGSLKNTGRYSYTSYYTKGYTEDTADWMPKYGSSDFSTPDFGKTFWFDEEWCPGLRGDVRYSEITNKNYAKP